MPTFTKTLVRHTALSLALLMAPIAVPSVQAASRYQYVREVNQALPSGLNINNAPTSVFQDAVQRVILAHPASEAPTIAGALAKAAPLERGKEIAEAIGKLFPNHPALAAQVVEIARQITISIKNKLRPDGEPDFKGTIEPESPTLADACATEIGNVAAILAYHLDPSNPANQALIIQLVQAVVLVGPELDFTAKIVEIFTATLRALGVPDDLLDQVERGVLDVIDDPAIREQIRASLKRLKSDDVMFPPGYIIHHETPVTNG